MRNERPVLLESTGLDYTKNILRERNTENNFKDIIVEIEEIS